MKCSRLHVREAGITREIRENFIPRKFPPIQYTPTVSADGKQGIYMNALSVHQKERRRACSGASNYRYIRTRDRRLPHIKDFIGFSTRTCNSVNL